MGCIAFTGFNFGEIIVAALLNCGQCKPVAVKCKERSGKINAVLLTCGESHETFNIYAVREVLFDISDIFLGERNRYGNFG